MIDAPLEATVTKWSFISGDGVLTRKTLFFLQPSDAEV